jgi:hypothetical protein
MSDILHTSTNRVLVVDDDSKLIGEYIRCLGEDFEPDAATATLGDLEKVLFGEVTDRKGAARFEVHSRNQGEQAVAAVESAMANREPFRSSLSTFACHRVLTALTPPNRFALWTRTSISSS